MLSDRYVNPFTDFGFKKLFGEEPNKEFLISFLNTLLPSYHKIDTLTYTKSEHLGTKQEDRKAIFDLYCKSKDGSRFIVEVQKAKQDFFKDRSVFYSTFPIQEQAKRGDWDFKLSHVYTIGILDFLFSDSEGTSNVKTHVQLKDQNNNIFYDKLSFIYLEMPKFNKALEDLETNFDKWLYVFKNLSNLSDRPSSLQEKVFERFFKVAEISNFSKEEYTKYEDSLKHYRDIKNVVDTSKREGIEEGMQKGIQKANYNFIVNSINKGFTSQVISDLTGVPIKDIEAIRSEI